MSRDTIRDILYRNSLARFVEDIEAASREGKSVLDVILPNGKRLGDCLLKQAQSAMAAWDEGKTEGRH